MSTEFPDAPTIRRALSLAIRAPSMQNSQPWRWQVGAHALHLYANGVDILYDNSFGPRTLLLSCGSALNHCVVGLAALGWQAKIHRLPDNPASEHLAAIELHRFPAAEADVMLAAAIPRRRTDRRRYSAWPVPRGDLALMGARAMRAGVTMRRVEARGDLVNVVATSASRHADAPCTGQYLSNAETLALHLPSSEPAVQLPVPDPAGSARDHAAEDPWGDEHGVVVALGTTTDDKMAHLRAGEATSVVLLTATALGLASCPSIEPLADDTTRESLRENVFGEYGAVPQMLVRIGWAPVNADPLPATPRRELAEAVEWLDTDGGAP